MQKNQDTLNFILFTILGYISHKWRYLGVSTGRSASMSSCYRRVIINKHKFLKALVAKEEKINYEKKKYLKLEF